MDIDSIYWTSPPVVLTCSIVPCEHSINYYQNGQLQLLCYTLPNQPHFDTIGDAELCDTGFPWNDEVQYQTYPSFHQVSPVSVSSQGITEVPPSSLGTIDTPIPGDTQYLEGLDECEETTPSFFNESGPDPFDEMITSLSNSIIPTPTNIPVSDFQLEEMSSPSQTLQTKFVPLNVTDSKTPKRPQTQKGKQ
jgi:hypothetical protein